MPASLKHPLRCRNDRLAPKVVFRAVAAIAGSWLGTSATAKADSHAAPTSSRPEQARACILVYLLGGPPHLDMWDLQPHLAYCLRQHTDDPHTDRPSDHLTLSFHGAGIQSDLMSDFNDI